LGRQSQNYFPLIKTSINSSNFITIPKQFLSLGHTITILLFVNTNTNMHAITSL